LFACLVGKTHI